MYFRLNLSSRVYLDRRSVRRWLLLGGGLLALVLAANLLYAVRNIQQLRQVGGHLTEIESKLASQRSSGATKYTPDEYARVMARIGAANKLIEADQFRWSVLLDKLEKLLPEGVAIRNLDPDFKEHSLKISAVARDTAAMTALLDALLSSADMRKVQLTEQSWTTTAGSEAILSFSIEIQEAF